MSSFKYRVGASEAVVLFLGLFFSYQVAQANPNSQPGGDVNASFDLDSDEDEKAPSKPVGNPKRPKNLTLEIPNSAKKRDENLSTEKRKSSTAESTAPTPLQQTKEPTLLPVYKGGIEDDDDAPIDFESIASLGLETPIKLFEKLSPTRKSCADFEPKHIPSEDLALAWIRLKSVLAQKSDYYALNRVGENSYQFVRKRGTEILEVLTPGVGGCFVVVIPSIGPVTHTAWTFTTDELKHEVVEYEEIENFDYQFLGGQILLDSNQIGTMLKDPKVIIDGKQGNHCFTGRGAIAKGAGEICVKRDPKDPMKVTLLGYSNRSGGYKPDSKLLNNWELSRLGLHRNSGFVSATEVEDLRELLIGKGAWPKESTEKKARAKTLTDFFEDIKSVFGIKK